MDLKDPAQFMQAVFEAIERENAQETKVLNILHKILEDEGAKTCDKISACELILHQTNMKRDLLGAAGESVPS